MTSLKGRLSAKKPPLASKVDFLDEKPPDPPDPPPWLCPLCDNSVKVTLRSPTQRQCDHLRSKHHRSEVARNLSSIAASGVNIAECTNCSNFFSAGNGLAKHKKTCIKKKGPAGAGNRSSDDSAESESGAPGKRSRRPSKTQRKRAKLSKSSEKDDAKEANDEAMPSADSRSSSQAATASTPQSSSSNWVSASSAPIAPHALSLDVIMSSPKSKTNLDSEDNLPSFLRSDDSKLKSTSRKPQTKDSSSNASSKSSHSRSSSSSQPSNYRAQYRIHPRSTPKRNELDLEPKNQPPATSQDLEHIKSTAAASNQPASALPSAQIEQNSTELNSFATAANDAKSDETSTAKVSKIQIATHSPARGGRYRVEQQLLTH